MTNKVYCDDCVHCRPDNSILVSFFGLDKKHAMEFAKCAASPKETVRFTHARNLSSEAVEWLYCSSINDNNDCRKFEAKAKKMTKLNEIADRLTGTRIGYAMRSMPDLTGNPGVYPVAFRVMFDQQEAKRELFRLALAEKEAGSGITFSMHEVDVDAAPETVNQRLLDALRDVAKAVAGLVVLNAGQARFYAVQKIIAFCDAAIAAAEAQQAPAHVETATGKPVGCIKCNNTGWLTGPGHDGEACECNQVKAPAGESTGKDSLQVEEKGQEPNRSHEWLRRMAEAEDEAGFISVGGLVCDIEAKGQEPAEPLWIDKVIQDVAELPDRDSPNGWPEAMLVTADELKAIILNQMQATAAQEAEPVIHKPVSCPTCHCSQTLPHSLQQCGCSCHWNDRTTNMPPTEAAPERIWRARNVTFPNSIVNFNSAEVNRDTLSEFNRSNPDFTIQFSDDSGATWQNVPEGK